MLQTSGQRRHHRSELDERTFAAYGAAGSYREERGKRFDEALSRRNPPIAEYNRFHVIGRGNLTVKSRAEMHDRAREQSADRRNDESTPQRQFSETLYKPRRAAAR